MTDYRRRTAIKLAGLLTATGLSIDTVTAASEPGVTVTESGGSTDLNENGVTDDYTVVLDTQPAADVTIYAEPDEELTTDKDSLTFTPLNWDDPQTITVSAVDDPDIETDPHQGTVTHTAESIDPNYNGINVRDVTASIGDNDVFVELEALMTNVDQENEEIEVMGITADVSDAEIHSPTAELTVSDLEGDPFPGRGSTPGFVDGTVVLEGSSAETGGAAHAENVTVIVAENVIVGPVTENTIPSGGSLHDGALAVQNAGATPIDDDRLPLKAVIGDTGGLTVDLGSIPEGSICTLEGYYAQDGNHYPYVIEAGKGDAPGDQTGISRARCGSSDELRIEGASSTYPETITFYDHDTGEELGSTDATYDPETTVGMFEFTKEVAELSSGTCPDTVRAENSNGSEDIAEVE